MSRKAARWITGNMVRITKQQQARIRPRLDRRPVRQTEQIRRYLAGEERWRLEQGLVTPEQWAQYEAAMRQRLEEV